MRKNRCIAWVISCPAKSHTWTWIAAPPQSSGQSWISMPRVSRLFGSKVSCTGGHRLSSCLHCLVQEQEFHFIQGPGRLTGLEVICEDVTYPCRPSVTRCGYSKPRRQDFGRNCQCIIAAKAKFFDPRETFRDSGRLDSRLFSASSTRSSRQLPDRFRQRHQLVAAKVQHP